VIYKFASQNNLDSVKEFTCYQIQEGAKLGTQGSIHRIYERDREMVKALAMSNAAILITPVMKEDLKIYKSNNLITNYKHRWLFKPSNYGNRRLNWSGSTSSPSTYQSGFTAGQNASQPFLLNGGESLGPTLSPKGTPGHLTVAVHHKTPNEAKDVVPPGNTRLVSEGPPQVLLSEGRQVGKEDLYQVLVDDWWCLLGSIRYHAELYRLNQSLGILQEKEMLSRIRSPQPSKKDL
jgi:hypothetical protein